MRTFRVPAFIAIAISASLVLVSCSKDQFNTHGQFKRGVMHFNATEPCQENCLVNPLAEITTEETDLLLSLLEQEEMIWSVYATIPFSRNVLDNITPIEYFQAEKISLILDHYQIEHTLLDVLEPGMFDDVELIADYEALLDRIGDDWIEALTVAVEMEENLICDLKALLVLTTNEAIVTILEGIVCASSNHLRVFALHLPDAINTYEPSCLTGEEFNNIVLGGPVSCGGE